MSVQVERVPAFFCCTPLILIHPRVLCEQQIIFFLITYINHQVFQNPYQDSFCAYILSSKVFNC